MTALQDVPVSMTGEDLAADLAAALRSAATTWRLLDRAQTERDAAQQRAEEEAGWARALRNLAALEPYGQRRYLVPQPVDGRLKGAGVQDRGRWLPPFVPAEHDEERR